MESHVFVKIGDMKYILEQISIPQIHQAWKMEQGIFAEFGELKNLFTLTQAYSPSAGESLEF